MPRLYKVYVLHLFPLPWCYVLLVSPYCSLTDTEHICKPLIGHCGFWIIWQLFIEIMLFEYLEHSALNVYVVLSFSGHKLRLFNFL